MSRKPKVITNCVADHYSGRNEKIIEYTFGGDGSGGSIGGLISFIVLDDGTPMVQLYRQDRRIKVIVGRPDA